MAAPQSAAVPVSPLQLLSRGSQLDTHSAELRRNFVGQCAQLFETPAAAWKQSDSTSQPRPSSARKAFMEHSCGTFCASASGLSFSARLSASRMELLSSESQPVCQSPARLRQTFKALFCSDTAALMGRRSDWKGDAPERSSARLIFFRNFAWTSG